jgi:TP53 regulating kinase-like protein
MKQIAQGAEAKIYLDDDKIIKSRIKKSYRLAQIDDKLRKFRTRRESKVISKLAGFGPKLIDSDDSDMTISMEYLDGPKVRDILEKSDHPRICRQIGETLRKIHDMGIIHGDLTTSNMIYQDKKVRFIDFGLSFFSEKIEDRAVDLHLLRQALESKHHSICQECISSVLSAYRDRQVISRLEAVERRGRNKSKL